MRAVPLVMLVALLSFSGCAPSVGDPGLKTTPSSASQGKTVDVEIIVGSKPDLDAQCLGNVSATTVFVVNQKEVYHCIGKKLHDHAEHGKTPGMDNALVRVSTDDRIRWFSKTSLFTVMSVTKASAGLAPQDKAAPDLPFGKDFPGKHASEVLSPPVPEVPGNVQQRYKVTFNIQGIGTVDPDVVCSM